jgi:5-methylthioadenosine/S-adenosylhomocysteine deaminase
VAATITRCNASVRDPIKPLVYNAQTDDVETVIIDGQVAMRDRQIPGADITQLAGNLQAAGERVWAAMKSADRIGRGADGLSPKLYPTFLER